MFLQMNILSEAQKLCHENGSLLVVDEVQTGFCRTGPMFVSGALGVKADFLTMARGIAGGFPFGAFAMSQLAFDALNACQKEYSEIIVDVCGKGLLILIEFKNEVLVTRIKEACLARRFFVT